MLTAEGGDRNVTRNYSYFNKLLLDTQFPLSDALEETSSDKDVPHALIHPVSSSQDHTNRASEDTNSRASAQAEPLLRRSARVPKPPKNLIHTMRPSSLFV